MKSVYWRPRKISQPAVLAMGLFASVSLTLVELLPLASSPPYLAEKMCAVELAEKGRQAIRRQRERLHLRINHAFDPRRTGLVGNAMSCITSKPADLAAKHIALHPQFPAAMIQILVDAGVRKGDLVAVGWSGSFPGLNLALSSAMEAMHLQPIIIASVMASQYGANEPDFVWLDMERTLDEMELIHFRSRAATIGGPADRGLGMSAESLQAARDAMQRNDVQPLVANRLAGFIDARMQLYQQRSTNRHIAAYINVGGGIASTGGSHGKSQFQPGVNISCIKGTETTDCVMRRFLEQGTPVIHLAETQKLARQFGLADTDESWHATSLPLSLGNGPSRLLAFLVLLAILAVLRAFILTDLGFRLLRDLLSRARLNRRPALRMVGQPSGPQLMA